MKNFTTVIIIVVLHLSYCQCQSGFYCLRDEEDFNDEDWEAFFPYTYATTSSDLPAIFQGKIQGEGIFYFDGFAGFGDQSITKSSFPTNLEEPVYLYVKYYAHNESGSNAEPYVLPAKYPDNGYNYYLKLEDDFLWKEEVVEIDMMIALQAGITSGIYTAVAGDYYLIDTMVIGYGGNISPDEVVGLCPPKILPTTTPPVTDSTTDSTTTDSTTDSTTTDSTTDSTTESTIATTTTATVTTPTIESTLDTTVTSTITTTTTESSSPPTTPATPPGSSIYTTEDTGTNTVPTATASSDDGGQTTMSSTSSPETTTTIDPGLPPIVVPPDNGGLEPYAIALVSFFSLLILLILATIFYFILTRRRRRRRQDSDYSEFRTPIVIPTAIPRPSYAPSIYASSADNLYNNRHSVPFNSQQARPSDATYLSRSNLLPVPGVENGLMNRRGTNVSNLSRASGPSTYSGITNKEWVIPRLARD